MKHLMQVLKALNLGSVQDLLKYLTDCFEYEIKDFKDLNEVTKTELLKSKTYDDFEQVSILVKTDDVKYYEFVIQCLIATKNISYDEATDLIENSEGLYKLGVEFQTQIIELQTIVKDPADPNDKATN